MKLSKSIAMLCLLQAICLATVSAQDDPLKFSGELYIDNRFRLDGGTWSWNENRLDLQLDKRFSGKARLHGQVWLRSFGFPLITTTDQLFNKDMTSPYNIDIREAYAEFYGLFTRNLDVKIGRQRIAWGTADRLNPTDNLNAYDLEDIWDFGRHLGSDAIRATYYIHDFYVEADYIPFFRPAALPVGDWGELMVPSPALPEGFYLAAKSDSVAMPANNLKEGATYGLKAGGYPGGFNFSVSYVYGRDGLPVPYRNTISLYDMEGGLALRTYVLFPRLHIIGADVAGNIGSVGIWAEAALFLPEKEIIMTTDLSAFGLPPVDSVVLEKKPYVKYVAGMDYTFRGGHYFNLQYLHGFVHERGTGELNDYLVLSYEKLLFQDKLRVKPLTMAFVVTGWNDIRNNYAFVYMPFLDYMPVADVEVSLGVRVITGEGEGLFSGMKAMDEFVFSLRYNF
jgi:hypothetical protein